MESRNKRTAGSRQLVKELMEPSFTVQTGHPHRSGWQLQSLLAWPSANEDLRLAGMAGGDLKRVGESLRAQYE
jgi:hypothetical protein